MLAKSVLNRQLSNALRGNKFGVMSMVEEFPFTEQPRTTPKPPSVAGQSSKNGIKIIARDRASAISTIRFAVLGGSSTETAAQKGAAHFLATAGFAGNKKTSGFRLVRHLEGKGAIFCSKADREKIVFDVAVMPNYAESAMESLLETLATPPLHDHVFEELRHDVQHHYDCLWECSETALNELIHEAAYGQQSAFGSSLYANRLDQLSLENILAYRKKHFVRDNIVIAADGISAEKAASIVDKFGSEIPSGKFEGAPQAKYTGGEAKVRCSEHDHAHYALAFSTPAGQNGKAYDALHSALCYRLNQKKICASTFRHKYGSTGLLGVASCGDVQDIEKVMKKTIDELKAIANNGASADFGRNKSGVCSFSTLESNCGAKTLLNAHLNGVADANALIDTRTVTAQQISDAAKNLLKSNPSWAVYGNTAGSPSVNTVAKWLA